LDHLRLRPQQICERLGLRVCITLDHPSLRARWRQHKLAHLHLPERLSDFAHQSEGWQIFDGDLLSPRRHHAFDRRIAGLIETLLSAKQRRQDSLDKLMRAFNFALGFELIAFDLELQNHGNLRQVQKLGKHGRNLAMVTAHTLLPAEDDIKATIFSGSSKYLRGAERIEIFKLGIAQMNGIVDAAGQSVPEHVSSLVAAHAESGDFSTVFFLEP